MLRPTNLTLTQTVTVTLCVSDSPAWVYGLSIIWQYYDVDVGL